MATKTAARRTRVAPSKNGNGRPSKESAGISTKTVEAFQKRFRQDPGARVAQNAVTRNPIGSVAANRQSVVGSSHVFSNIVKVGKITSQQKSGRCWLFAGLNPMRVAAIKAMNLADDFELSQNYPLFWDKLEKANYFLENIIKTSKEPVGSRILDFLLSNPVEDGGQWDMFVNLVTKFGVVPKTVMPETESSSNTGAMNSVVTRKLRENAAKLRKMCTKGLGVEALRKEKTKMLEEVYRILAIHLGEPPKDFLWQYRDKDGAFHRDGRITPQEFFARHVNTDLDSKICLIHCPQSSKSFNTLYTVDFLGNVVDGNIVRYLNVDLNTIKKAAIEMISDGEPVWFGCDVGKHLERELGVLDLGIFDYDGVYGVKFGMDKATRLDYGESQMTHAMVFAGVDLDDRGKPVRWRVENSWGDKGGGQGFLTMTDAWFDEYVYEVAVDKNRLPASMLPLLKGKPVVLPPWDPMGSLAR
jgi:bleomycin hydrolase